MFRVWGAVGFGLDNSLKQFRVRVNDIPLRPIMREEGSEARETNRHGNGSAPLIIQTTLSRTSITEQVASRRNHPPVPRSLLLLELR